MKLPFDVKNYLAEHRVAAIRINNGNFYSINDDIPELDTPAEPLIKDEKIRKAVRAWAEANDYNIVKAGYDTVSEPDSGNYQIHFEDGDVVSEDNYGVHTIAELCGEEE